MSLPLKIMNSYVSARGGMGLGTWRSSVPKERTVEEGKRGEESHRFVFGRYKCCTLRHTGCPYCSKNHERVIPFARVTVASLVSTAYSIPSYLISAFEIRLILLPM